MYSAIIFDVNETLATPLDLKALDLAGQIIQQRNAGGEAQASSKQ